MKIDHPVRCGLWLLAVSVVLGATAPDVGAADSTQERLFIFLDVSGSMRNRIPGSTDQMRFDEASATALEHAFQELVAGKAVRVIPFAEGPTDGSGLLVTPKAGVPTEKSYREIASYLAGTRPPAGVRRYTAIWDTLTAFSDLLAKSGPNTTIAIYTDGDDNRSKNTKEDVEARLRRAWRLDGRAKISIYEWIWSPVQKRTPPPNASVGIKSRRELQVRLSELAKGAAASRDVAVVAGVSKRAAATDGFRSLRVRVTPLTPRVPPLKVSAKLAAPLTRASPNGTVKLRFTGDFPTGKLDALYELRLMFRFHTDAQGVAPGDREREVAAGSALRVRVSSNPTHRIRALLQERLELYPGQSASFECEVEGNEDARGTACVLSTLFPKGVVDVGLSLPSSKPLADGELGQSSLNVVLKGPKEPTRVRVTARGVARGDGEISVLALNSGRTVNAGVSITVRQPKLLPRLMRSGETTEIPEGADGRQWHPLACGPLRMGVEGDLTGVQAHIEAMGNTSDIEIGLGADAKPALTVNLGDPDARVVALQARWRTEAPPREFKTPTLRVTIDGKAPFTVLIEPESLDLSGMIVLPGASIGLQGAEPGHAFENRGGDVVLVLPTKRVRVGERASWEALLNWSGDAAGRQVGVSIEGSSGLPADALQVEPGSSVEAQAPGKWKLGGDSKGSTRFAVGAQAPNTSGTYIARIAFRLADSAGPPRIVELPLEVGPALIPIEVSTGAGAILARDLSLPLAQVVIESGTAPGATVSVRALVDAPGVSVEVEFESTGLAQATVPTGGVRRDRLMATLRAAPDLALNTLKGTLTFMPSWDGGDVRLVDAQGNAVEQITLSLDVTVKTLGLAAVYDDEPCDAVPPSGRAVVDGADKIFHRTSTYRRPFSIVLTGGLPLPPQHEGVPLTVAVVDAAGMLASVAFDVEDEEQPLESVPLRDLPLVRGLVFRSTESVPGDEVFGTAKIEIRAEDIGLVRALDVPLHRPSDVPWIWIMAGAGVLAVAGLIYLGRRRRSDLDDEAPSETEEAGSGFPDKLEEGGRAEPPPIGDSPSTGGKDWLSDTTLDSES